MLTALAVFLLGAGLTAAGLWQSILYDIGVVVMVLAVVGIVVRGVEWVRWVLR